MIKAVRLYLKEDELNKLVEERKARSREEASQTARSAAYRLHDRCGQLEEAGNPGIPLKDGRAAVKLLLGRKEGWTETTTASEPSGRGAGRREAVIGKEATEDFQAKRKKITFDIDTMGPAHTTVTGSTGSGKTVAAQRIASEVSKSLVPVVVLTPEEEWYDLPRAAQLSEQGVNRSLEGGFEPSVNVLDLSGREDPYRFSGDFLGRIYETFREKEETERLKLLVAVEEAHHLLEEEETADQLEKFARVMRKRGVGLLLISHVYSDFPKGIRANISTNLFMGTDWRGDLNLLKQYAGGKKLADRLLNCPPGYGIFRSRYLNRGKPTLVYILPPGEEKKEKGISKRREAIIEIVKGADHPLPAGRITDLLKREGFTVDSSTVYRDLKELQKRGHLEVAKKGKRGKRFYQTTT